MARIRAMASCCVDSPVWPSTSNVGVVGLHRQQVRARRHLGADQAVEADLVADHVAEPDPADVEHHRPVARR